MWKISKLCTERLAAWGTMVADRLQSFGKDECGASIILVGLIASAAAAPSRATRSSRLGGGAAAGRRRHFNLAELLLADSGSGRRWRSGDRGDR
jgi:hypothetical protein